MKRPREKIAADYKPKKQWTVAERREYYRRALKRHRAKSKFEFNAMKQKNSELEMQVNGLQNTYEKLSDLAECSNNITTSWSDEYLHSQNIIMKKKLDELCRKKKLLLGVANLQMHLPNYPCENIYHQIVLAEEQALTEFGSLKCSNHDEVKIFKAVTKRELIYVKLLNAGRNFAEFSIANLSKEKCSKGKNIGKLQL
eukprot:snap_masked-scaffold_39-processed-gene-2.31-mRNA-1 protein AED:1.00 eAED:1.00 QI:0/0/0/0/1/1/2/0/197